MTKRLLVLLWAVGAAVAWWMALVYFETYTLAATALATVYMVFVNALIGRSRVMQSRLWMVLSAIPATIVLGAVTVYAAWLLALVI